MNRVENRLEKRKLNRICLLVAIPALLLMLVFCVVPFFHSLVISFKSYSLTQGIQNSPFVGFKNYNQLLNNQDFRTVILNTVYISGVSILLSAIFVFLLTLCISRIKQMWGKIIVIIIAIIPVLMPENILINVISSLNKDILMTPSLYIIGPILNEMFLIAPIVILAGAFATMKDNNIKTVLYVTLSYIAIRILYLFMPDMQFIYNSYSPLVYQTSEVLSTYMLRSLFMQNRISDGSAVYIIRVALQIIPSILGVISLIILPKKFLHNDNNNIKELKYSKLYYILAILALPMTVLCLISTFGKGNIFSLNRFYSSLSISIIIAILSCVLFFIIFISLGFSLANKNKLLLILTSIFILLGENIIGQYLQFRIIGISYNIICVVIASAISYSVFFSLMLYVANIKNNNTNFKSFFRVSGGVIIAFVGIAFAKFFGNSLYYDMYYVNPDKLPVSILIKNISREEVSLFNIVPIVIIPVIVGVVCIIKGMTLYSKNN